MALVTLGCQRPVDPEAVEAGLLDDHKWIVTADSVVSFPLQRRELGKESANIASRDNVAGHLVPGAR